MTNYSTDCISTPPLPSLLATISACQLAATSPFCYPPNGTRICVSATPLSFPVYFPPSYYGADAKISLAYTLRTATTPRLPNTGNATLLVDASLYTTFGVDVPGRDEKTLALAVRALKPGAGAPNVYAGPTVVLVQTEDFPSASATGGLRYDDDGDALTGLTGGGVAGVVVGVVVGVIALVAAWCWLGCCGCCGKKRAGGGEGERSVKQGVELMEQGGARGVGPGPDEMAAERARVDEEVVRDYVDPPPGYKP